MKAFLAALLLGLCTAAAAQSPVPSLSPDSPQVEAALAFARTYGVVRYFHPSDSLDRVDWDRFLVYGSGRMASITDAASMGSQLEALFAPIVDGFKVAPKGSPAPAVPGDGPSVEWRHLGYGMEPTPRNQPFVSWRTHHDPLHDGKIKGPYFQHQGMAEAVKADPPIVRVPVGTDREALVPVSLPMSATKIGEAQDAKLKELAKTLEPASAAGEAFNRAQAWADGIAAWNVARHFYPYWSVLPIDWEAWLRQWLAAQPATQSREQLRDQLRRLIAPLDDGHAGIAEAGDRRERQLLPISVRPLGNRWVVEASLVPERVKPGDVIVGVNGQPAEGYFEKLMTMESGGPQFVRWRAAREICFGPPGGKIAFRLQRGARTVNQTLTYDREKIVVMPRPDPVSEVRPGVWYVDLSRFQRSAFDASREKLAGARAIIFDLRGYPSPDAVAIVPYWLTIPDTAQWMIVPRFDAPYAQSTTGWSIGWQIERNAALEKPVKVLLTDGRAISYAESLIGYFAAHKTGRILGERTGGANGNAVAATLPSGMRYVFTGMRVTRHDGTIYHREGFAPDETVVPTTAGLAAGKDEPLERAISEVTQP